MENFALSQEKKAKEEKRFKFLLDDIIRTMEDIEIQMKVKLALLSDEDIQRKKDDLPI